MALDRDRLMREYAPTLAERADGLGGPQAPGGTVKDPDTLGGLLDVQVVGDVVDEKDGKGVEDVADVTDKADQLVGDDGDSEPVETENTGVMVALWVPADAADLLALGAFPSDDPDVEEPDELHLTLAYLGTAGVDVTPDRLDLFAQTVTTWAGQEGPIAGVVSGLGIFNNEDTAVTYASFDAPDLPAARQRLVQMLEAAGFAISGEHGFTPHITLAYGDVRDVDLPRVPITFNEVTLAYADTQLTIPLGFADDGTDETPVTPNEAKAVPLGEDVPPEDDPHADDDPDDPKDDDEPRPAFIAGAGTMTTTARDAVIHNGLPSTTSNGVSWNPIVTTSGARTVITGPATTERAAMWGSVPNPNKHMLWMQGRFVGAERPNRNGAYWSTGDLEVGNPTVAHGPLNWLHEERHVIGTIADAKLIAGDLQRDLNPDGVSNQLASEMAAETTDPHITALSAIWSWIYPQEASVVQMASDAGVLAYSMECIAQAIQCVGDSGCGETFPYMQVAAAGGGCQHLRQRGSVRRLVNPTFLGGAVIVPPTRPGWADADASVMKEAASMAERAYDQAGRPDIPATTWEQLMAGVVTYTRDAQ